MKKALIAGLLILSSATVMYPQRAIAGLTLNPRAQEIKDEVLPLAQTEWLFLQNEKELGIIKRGDKTGSISVKITSKERTRIKVRWSDENIGFAGRNPFKAITLGQHQTRTLSFTAYGETKGEIEILNENDEVVLVIPYEARNDKKVTQSINSNINYSSSSDKTSLGLTYSLRTRPKHHFDGSWMFRVGTNYDNDGEYRINTSVTYSW